MAVVDRHLIKRLSFATEDLVEAGRIVGDPSVEQDQARKVGQHPLNFRFADICLREIGTGAI